MTGPLRTALFAFLLLLTAVPAAVAQTAPVVDVEFEKNQTIPGQFLTLRITVLVPTWMPSPVVFPPLDAPNVRVRLPERATSPTSRRVDGTEWPGVTRRYLISPMAPGRFPLPKGAVAVTYADPDNTSKTVTTTAALPVLEIEGVVPDGAEGLSPFIAAKGLTLTQDLSEPVTDLKPGDSIRRTVTAKITGAAPMMLPQLMDPPQIPGFAAYSDQPVLEESEDRGVISGSRRETLTLMVQGNGTGTLPGLALRWYNIGSNTIETALLDPVAISATGAPAAARDLVPSDKPVFWLLGAAALAGLALVFFLAAPVFVRAFRARRKRHRASKAFARKAALKAIAAHDYPATVAALQTWADRSPVTMDTDRQTVLNALRPISARRYGGAGPETEARDWRSLAEAVRHAANHPHGTAGHTRLPALNP
ncbi:hypothetical protein [uncultured Roseibium sp.]|uniref:hypothetical protein n=1 Tax=uncultured Roseibium sp. TaxID=1936171 RepID=UPI003217601A